MALADDNIDFMHDDDYLNYIEIGKKEDEKIIKDLLTPIRGWVRKLDRGRQISSQKTVQRSDHERKWQEASWTTSGELCGQRCKGLQPPASGQRSGRLRGTMRNNVKDWNGRS